MARQATPTVRRPPSTGLFVSSDLKLGEESEPFTDWSGEAQKDPPADGRVALKRDLPEHSLRRGDVAVLIDHVTHPEGGEPSCVLEVFNAVGESIAVVAVRESDVEALRADEVLAVRPMAKAG